MSVALVPTDVVALAAPSEGPSLVLPSEQPYVVETDTGLTFRPDTPLEIWGELTARLIHAHKKLEFALADAINFGETVMQARYGQRYTQWIHATGRSNDALRRIAYIGRQIEPGRRRHDIPFSVQAEVAPLPPKMQTTILDLAVEKNWNREEVRGATRIARAEIKRAERAELPVPEPPIEIDLRVESAIDLSLDDASVDLIITSPPYALERPYTHGDVLVGSWYQFMMDWLAEAYRVARPHARLALNVPLDTTLGNFRPTYAQAVTAVVQTGWTYRSTQVWADDQLGKSTARGSVDSATAPHLVAPVEMIILASKGEWHRDAPDDRPTDLLHDDWLEWTNGLWRFPGESRPWEDHPAPFPLELPRRLLHLLSFPGDVVLDPFLGSGTTALACLQAGRSFIGVDLSGGYVDSTKRRLAAWRAP